MRTYQSIPGNYYDKYHTANVLEKFLVSQFLSRLDSLVKESPSTELIDVGCGEGEISYHFASQGYSVIGIDREPAAISIASERPLAVEGTVRFIEHSIYEVDSLNRTWPMVLCLEVLEHLERPEFALEKLQSIASGTVILSVPREPLWRILNIARGSYLTQLGNTPGHIQHWSASAFVRLVSRYFDIVSVYHPVPWTMVSARKRA